MANIFPTDPAPGDTFVVGTTTYRWTGQAWIKISTTAQLENLTLKNLTATNSIIVTSSTNATSTITGALQVVGGVGIGQDVWIGGKIVVGNTSTINGADILTTATLDSYVKPTLIVGGTDTAVTSSTGVVTVFTVWNTSTLQSVTNRGSTTTNQITILNSTSATSITSAALVVAGGIAAGGDLWLGGTIYSAGVPVITTSTLIDSFQAGEDIKISTTSSLSTGTIGIIISNTSTFQTVTTRGNTTNRQLFVTDTTESTSSSTGAVVISGGLGVAGRINSESLQIADTIIDSGMILVNTTDTVVVDEYDIDEYRTSKYLIQINDGTGLAAEFETIELLLLVDNAGNVYATEYAILTSNGDLGEFQADVIGDKVRLYFTAYQPSDKVLKIFRTTMRV